MQNKLSINLGKLKLKNPVMVASGTFGYAEEFKDFIDLKQLGAIVTKTITLKPRSGNPMPRTCETPAGMLNSIGLENPGIERFIKDKIPFLNKLGVPLIVSIASESDPEEFYVLIKKLEKINTICAIELNISCPNIRHARHTSFGAKLIAQDPEATYEVVSNARKITSKTLITKLSPNVTDITAVASAAERAGSDCVALINTLGGMSIDVETRQAKIACVTGGLSGPAIRPIAVKMVWEAHKKIKIPIIGMGGIIDAQSALEFFLAGATAVSVGTANFINPKVTEEIINGLKEYLAEKKIEDISQIIGRVKV